VLLPKKNDVVDAKDYRPVSLMHSAAKILIVPSVGLRAGVESC
jgi:hypothetical protein